MQKSIFALVALSVVGIGLGWRNHVKTQVANQVTIIETSDNVTHPVLHTGETLVFQVPPTDKDTQTYVHFDPTPGNHPCDETTIPKQKGGPLECKVTAIPKAASFYLYLIDTDPTENPMTKNSVKCPPWCPGTLVVAPVPKSDETPTKLQQQSGPPYSAVEVAIYNLSGLPDPVPANLGQKVTWFNPGTDSHGWTVQFEEDNICQEGKNIPSAKGVYCTVKMSGYHPYTITVDGKTGSPSYLYVVPPPPDPPKPQ